MKSSSSVALIFEASERADSLVKKHFGVLELEEGGLRIPVEHCLMPKSAGSPGLEVADFIMHAVGRAVRHRLAGKPGYPRDFGAVFHRCDLRLVSVMIVDRIERQPDATSDAAVAAGFPPPSIDSTETGFARAIRISPEEEASARKG